MPLKKEDDLSPKSVSSDDGVRDRATTAVTASVENEYAHVGVKKVEATHKVYGKYSKWFLFTR